MSIHKRAKDMGVSDLVKKIEKLEEENKNLKEKLEQIKEAYIRFEKVDSEFQRGLGELDQLIMNR